MLLRIHLKYLFSELKSHQPPSLHLKPHNTLYKIYVGERTVPQKRGEQCFGIQPKYQSYCRASGNRHIPVNTCGITRARAPGHQPSQILSHTEQYHPSLHSSYWLRGRKWCILTFHLCLADSADKRSKPLPAAKPRENNHIVLNMIQLHFIWDYYVFIKHLGCTTAAIVSHAAVKVAKWHSHWYHRNVPLKCFVHYVESKQMGPTNDLAAHVNEIHVHNIINIIHLSPRINTWPL